jgi:hypothetical protein
MVEPLSRSPNGGLDAGGGQRFQPKTLIGRRVLGLLLQFDGEKAITDEDQVRKPNAVT